MKNIFWGFLVGALSCALIFSPGPGLAEAESNSLQALVYAGSVSAEGCPEAVAAVLEKLGFTVRYVRRDDQIASQLSGVSLFVIGGTEDNTEPLRRALVPDQKAAITQFVRDGGRFWGICGGAYLASRGWEEYWGDVEGLDLVPATTDYYSYDEDPMVIHVNWLGTDRAIYYQGGPEFFLVQRNEPQVVELVATYQNGGLAGLMASLGQGKVLVLGPHPEADWSWIEEDGLEGRGWTSTEDLALAIVRDLMSDRPLQESFNTTPTLAQER